MVIDTQWYRRGLSDQVDTLAIMTCSIQGIDTQGDKRIGRGEKIHLPNSLITRAGRGVH